MFQRKYLSDYIKFGGAAAVAYAVPMAIFIHAGSYHSTWLLFLGNLLFLVAMSIYMLVLNSRSNENASTQSMVAAGHVATFTGIVTVCLLVLIALLLLNSGVFGGEQADKVLAQAPAQTGNGITKGMVFVLFMNAVIGNLCGGSFASLLIPYTARRNQTKDKSSEVLKN